MPAEVKASTFFIEIELERQCSQQSIFGEIFFRTNSKYEFPHRDQEIKKKKIPESDPDLGVVTHLFSARRLCVYIVQQVSCPFLATKLSEMFTLMACRLRQGPCHEIFDTCFLTQVIPYRDPNSCTEIIPNSGKMFCYRYRYAATNKTFTSSQKNQFL